jgi:hypothetical protein
MNESQRFVNENEEHVGENLKAQYAQLIVAQVEDRTGQGIMGAWQGVAMDFIVYHKDLLWPTLLSLVGGQPESGLTAVSGMASRRVGGLWPSSTPLDTARF